MAAVCTRAMTTATAWLAHLASRVGMERAAGIRTPPAGLCTRMRSCQLLEGLLLPAFPLFPLLPMQPLLWRVPHPVPRPLPRFSSTFPCAFRRKAETAAAAPAAHPVVQSRLSPRTSRPRSWRGCWASRASQSRSGARAAVWPGASACGPSPASPSTPCSRRRRAAQPLMLAGLQLLMQ